MTRCRKNTKLQNGQQASFEMYADGALETVPAVIQSEYEGEVVVSYLHPLYPEAGQQLKVLPKKALFI